MPNKVVLLVGLPGSRRSDFASRAPDGVTVLSRDRKGGRLVDLLPKYIDLLSEESVRTIVIDNTHLLRKQRAIFIAPARLAKVPIEAVCFDMTPSDCIVRMPMDIDRERQLPAFVFYNMVRTYEPPSEVIITTLKEASVRCVSDHCHGIIDDTPSIFWVLQVRPYCHVIRCLFLSYLAQERNVDTEACYTEVNGLLHLVRYMTRDEHNVYALSLCLMIEKLDYLQNEDGDEEDSDEEFDVCAAPPGTFSNVALEVLGVLGRMSVVCASFIMRYIDIDSGDAQVATIRQRRGLQLIERGLTSEELHELLAPLPDGHFLTLLSEETDLTDFAEWSTCIYLLRILIKANRRVDKRALRAMAWHIDSRGTFKKAGRGFGTRSVNSVN